MELLECRFISKALDIINWSNNNNIIGQQNKGNKTNVQYVIKSGLIVFFLLFSCQILFITVFVSYQTVN